MNRVCAKGKSRDAMNRVCAKGKSRDAIHRVCAKGKRNKRIISIILNKLGSATLMVERPDSLVP